MISVSLNPKKLDEKLDPRSINYTNEFYILENLTCRLVVLNEHGDYQLDLASDLKKISDTEYQFKIKETFFSNGEKVQLLDVKKTIERILKSGSSHVDFKGIISSLLIDEDKLIIKLVKPSKSFFYYLSLPDLGILHSSQISKEILHARDFVDISSGPFTYSVSNDACALKKNVNYRLASLDYPDKVVLKDPFSTDTIKDILSGDVQLGQGSVKSYLSHKKDIQDSANVRVLGVPSDSLTYLYFNQYSPKFKDSKLRASISDLIRSNFRIPSEYSDIARKTTQYFPPESIAYLSDSELAEAYSSRTASASTFHREELTIHTFTSAYDVTLEELVKSLESIPGIKIKIKTDIKPSEYIESMKKGEFDIFLNIISTDGRTPVEAINFEYFGTDSNLTDPTGLIKKEFSKYQDTTSKEEEKIHMKAISRQMIIDGQLIPLFHSAIPFVYDSKKVSLVGLSHLFVMNFWKLKTI